jgi:hypothetical protein
MQHTIYLLLMSALVMTGGKKTFQADGFSVTIPDTVDVTKRSPVEDFDIYVFALQGRPFLSAYAGNHPSFPSSDAKGSSRAAEPSKFINDCPSQTILTKKDGVPEWHVLIHLRTGGWPEYLHFWYTNTEPEQTALAEAIISSTKPSDVSNK